MPDSLTVAEEPDSMIPERIIRHLRELAPRRKKAILKTSCLLDFVENKAETTRPNSATFTVLCDILRGREPYHWREQVVAAWAIGRAELNEEQQKEAAVATAHLLDYGGKTRAQWHSSNIALGIAYAIGWNAFCGVFFILYILLYSFLRGVPDDRDQLLLAPFFVYLFSLVLTPVVPFTTIAVWSTRSHQTREEAARSLGSLGRAEGVPALLRASQNWEFFWTLGRKALARTLPSLKKETHYGTLDSDVVPNLCRLLEKSSDIGGNAASGWQITLLDALEKVGNARSLDTLSRLIKQVAPSQKFVTILTSDSFDCYPIVLERMVQVREVIVERVARETEAETLLRGSQAPIVPETLLRSYEGTIETPPEQLLRATIKEE